MRVNEIVCGDNVEVLSGYPAGSIDLVVTSPPYDALRVYGGHDWDFAGIASQLYRVIIEGGVLVWVVGDSVVKGSETGTSMRQALYFMDIGFRLHDTMIYQKSAPSFPETTRYGQVWEYMFVFSVGAPRVSNLIADKPNVTAGRVIGNTYHRDETNASIRTAGSGNARRDTGIRDNVWRFKVGGGLSSRDPVAFNHPALFPEQLARDHILTWTNEGDLVCDPFNGSGTTTKMAREMGRKYIGIDIHEEYCEIARKRLEQRLLFGEA